MSSAEDLAIAVTLLRTISGMNRNELAAAAGLANSTITEYEKARTIPRGDNLMQMMAAMGLPLAALDQTLAFIRAIRAQTRAGLPALADEVRDAEFPAAGFLLTDAALASELQQLPAEAAHLANRLVRVFLEVHVRKAAGGRDPDNRS